MPGLLRGARRKAVLILVTLLHAGGFQAVLEVSSRARRNVRRARRNVRVAPRSWRAGTLPLVGCGWRRNTPNL